MAKEFVFVVPLEARGLPEIEIFAFSLAGQDEGVLRCVFSRDRAVNASSLLVSLAFELGLLSFSSPAPLESQLGLQMDPSELTGGDSRVPA